MVSISDVILLSNEVSDICGQVKRLYDLTISIPKKDKIVVELGMRYGTSTKAILAAVNDSSGHLYSLDTYKLVSLDNEKNFTFILGDDMDLVKTWDKPIDHLFIDTSHLYDHTLSELNEWGSFVVDGGIITLHDTNQKGVMDAIKNYVEKNNYEFENFEESNGLAVIKKLQSNNWRHDDKIPRS